MKSSTNLETQTLKEKLAALEAKFAALEQKFNHLHEKEIIITQGADDKATNISVISVCQYPGRNTTFIMLKVESES